jgi:hypothetical protein
MNYSYPPGKYSRSSMTSRNMWVLPEFSYSHENEILKSETVPIPRNAKKKLEICTQYLVGTGNKIDLLRELKSVSCAVCGVRCSSILWEHNTKHNVKNTVQMTFFAWIKLSLTMFSVDKII